MTLIQAQERLARIAASAYDDEIAHSLEDNFHQDVLKEVASNNPQSSELAKIALLTLDLDFRRWCS